MHIICTLRIAWDSYTIIASLATESIIVVVDVEKLGMVVLDASTRLVVVVVEELGMVELDASSRLVVAV